MVIFLLIIHDVHLNLAQGGHYNFAVTYLVRAIIVMLNKALCHRPQHHILYHRIVITSCACCPVYGLTVALV